MNGNPVEAGHNASSLISLRIVADALQRLGNRQD
jgi:hypothetical protein